MQHMHDILAITRMKDLLFHLFSPHHTNSHKPRVLHHDSLFFLLALFLFISTIISGIGTRFPSVLGITSVISVQDLVNLTNEQRGAHGLPPLHLDTQLTVAAQKKAENMFALNYWAHIAPDGTTPWVFIKNSGYSYLYAGENLARGYSSASDVVTAWMASPSHRENMLSPNYNDVGFAVYDGSLTGSQTILVVQEFGSKYTPQPQAVPLGTQQNAVMTPTIILPSPTLSTGVISPSPAVVIQQPVVVDRKPSTPKVAASSNPPLIAAFTANKKLSMSFILFLIVILLLDIVIIERRKISRLVIHNFDHIIFLSMLLIAALIVGQGIVL